MPVTPFQCRATLKSGERCRYIAKDDGFCGIHKPSVTRAKKRLHALMAAGEIALTAKLLLEILKISIELLPKLAHHIQNLNICHLVMNSKSCDFDWVDQEGRSRPEELKVEAQVLVEFLSRENLTTTLSPEIGKHVVDATLSVLSESLLLTNSSRSFRWPQFE
jgi:hypothetical protein